LLAHSVVVYVQKGGWSQLGDVGFEENKCLRNNHDILSDEFKSDLKGRIIICCAQQALQLVFQRVVVLLDIVDDLPAVLVE